MKQQCRLTMRFPLSASHQLKHLEASSKKDGLHGHHYDIEVTLEGDLEPTSQWIYSRDAIKTIVHQTLLKPYDKKCLNKYFDHTSGEYLAMSFFQLLKETPLGPHLHSIQVQETAKNRFSYGL